MSTAPSISRKKADWKSLLTGQLRDEAEQAVRAIAAELAEPSEQVAAAECAHRSLFFGYLAEATGDKVYAERAFSFVNEGVTRAAGEMRHCYLYGGYAGLGWILTQLAGKVLHPAELENCEAIDAALIEFLRNAREPLRFELLYGLAGIGIYALERWPDPAGKTAAVEILGLVFRQLAATAERTATGLTWFTSAEFLPAWQRRLCPNGYYNLGLAHGVPGVLPLLAKACSIPAIRAQAWQLLAGAGRWLELQQHSDVHGNWFPHWRAAEIEPQPGRLAWCYGSLGAATAWLDAARRTGQYEWEQAALAMLRGTAQISVADAGVRDAAFCHGAGGNAHIFNRLYQATGEELFRKAALRWYAHMLSLREPGKGLAGFQNWAPSEDGEPGWESSPGLLDGAVGIGLILLAACSEITPDWDNCFQVALPPRSSD